MKRQATVEWQKIQAVIDWASDPKLGPERRAVMEHGTPEMKMAILHEAGLSFDELEAMHSELEKVIYKGSIPWWW